MATRTTSLFTIVDANLFKFMFFKNEKKIELGGTNLICCDDRNNEDPLQFNEIV